MSDPIDLGKKAEWPELVDLPATQAEQTIAHERPDVAVEVLPPGSPIVEGFDPERVRIFIDNNGLVSEVPKIG